MFRRYSRMKLLVLHPHFSHRGDVGRDAFTSRDRGAHTGPCRRPDLRGKLRPNFGHGRVGKKHNGPAVALQGRQWSVWDWLKA
jgi:hypothetical protein